MRHTVRLLVAASLLFAACGAPAPTALELTGSSGGQLLTVKVHDPGSIVVAVAISSPRAHFDDAQHKGIAFNVVDGEPQQLLVTWLGGACRTASAVVTVEPSASGISISAQEPWTLQGCQLQAGEVKAIELLMKAPVQLDAITGVLLPASTPAPRSTVSAQP